MRLVLMAVTAALVSGTVGCTSNPTITDPSQVVFPDTGVSYRSNVQPFMAVTCAAAGCHAETNAAGGVRLNSYEGIMFSRGNLAVPGKPDESLIIQVMDRRIAHSNSVIDRVTPNHLRGMRAWITAGALNN